MSDADWNRELTATAPEHSPEPEPEALPDAEAAAREMAKLSPLQYEQRRKAEAERLGVRASTLDAEVRRFRGEQEAEGAQLIFPKTTPSAAPVDGAALLDDLARTLGRYVVLPDHGAEAVAMFAAFAWAFDAWSTAPMLQINAPERACGKTRLLEVIGALVPKPLPTGSISAAALFRVIEAHAPCIMVDEVDTFLAENVELSGIINTGYTRAQAFTIRCDGDDNAVKPFRVWAPKVLCGIGELPDTIASRCLVITMRRKRPGEAVERIRADRQGWAEGLRSRLARWAEDSIERLREADPELPDALDDRQQDNWRPLVAIADLVGGEWPARAREAAVALSAPRAGQQETKGALLLAAIREVFDQDGRESIGSTMLVERLCDLPDSPWSEWNRGKPISARGVARILAGFEISPQKGRSSSVYVRRDFEDAWSRYLAPDPPSGTSTTSTTSTSLKSQGNSVEDRRAVEDASSTRVEDVEHARSGAAPSSTEKANDIKAVEDVELVEDNRGAGARTVRAWI